ncbi:MAG: nucleotidyltransferase domain-containing protein [Spirochaetales bacterium]|nr:nucleotidyltransferase domain-containing protein [Spirochaetales bacterium]
MLTIPLEPILNTHPTVQAVYLYGSRAVGSNTPDSDADIALLLPPMEAKAAGSLSWSPLRDTLEKMLGLPVDLVNLRQVSTVFQKEIIASGIRLYCAGEDDVDQFEMLVLSLYGKLNEERAEILLSLGKTMRAYEV